MQIELPCVVRFRHHTCGAERDCLPMEVTGIEHNGLSMHGLLPFAAVQRHTGVADTSEKVCNFGFRGIGIDCFHQAIGVLRIVNHNER